MEKEAEKDLISEITQAAISYAMKADYEKFVERIKLALASAEKKGREEGRHESVSKQIAEMIEKHRIDYQLGWNEAIEEARKVAESYKSGEHDWTEMYCKSCDSFCCHCELCGCCGNPSNKIANEIGKLRKE